MDSHPLSDHLEAVYLKPHFWQRAFFVGSAGGTTNKTVQRSVESRKKTEKAGRREKGRPLAPISLWPKNGAPLTGCKIYQLKRNYRNLRQPLGKFVMMTDERRFSRISEFHTL
jgi:hypothetical protein